MIIDGRSTQHSSRYDSDSMYALDPLYTLTCGHGYFGLIGVLGFGHYTVSHSQISTDPETGINTNTSNGTCNGPQDANGTKEPKLKQHF